MIRGVLVVAAVGTILTTVAIHRPAEAHHDNWAAPLVGGLVGGYAVKSFMDYRKKQDQEEEQPAPRPASAGPSATSIEDKLNTLDKLAAGGYITKQEYTDRRQALLDEL